MSDQVPDHVAEGWDTDGAFRWIAVGGLRLDETEDGAIASVHAGPPGSWAGTLGAVAPLSATALAGLVRHLAGWFIGDPAETMQQVEGAVAGVRAELAAWDDRARRDEEHPPYAKLVAALDGVIRTCKQLREEGPFAGSVEGSTDSST